jgi:eukaryotic-like serine/threonine-protein kinase
MTRRLGAFEVLHALKSGGMGDVLLGRRRGPGGFEQVVALKTIRADLAASEAVRAMFLDEARLLARLAHPAIATVVDFGSDGEDLYLAMEYVRGLRFRELAARGVPAVVAARAIAEACRGLHAAHELRDHGGSLLGVVHRDISPDNLMLGFDGQVKVLDFGIALVRGRMTVTELGTVKGKPPYMSPEQVRGEPLDRRSDVWSVGLVLHELLTGEPVFGGESIYQVARAVIEAEIAPPSARAGALPVGLDDAVMGALAREVEARTPTAGMLAEQLEKVAAGSESLASWAERTLAAEREAHRRWMSSLMAGEAGATVAGRATGVLTAAAEPAPQPEEAPPPPRVEEIEEEALPRRSRAALVVLILGALVAAIVALVVTRDRGAQPPPLAAAAPDAATATATAADAATATATDAAAATDAGTNVIARAHDRRDRRAPADAAIASSPPTRAPPIDAAPTPAASPGYLTITADPFANVLVDGTSWDSTPIYKRRLAAGRHTVILKSPDSGAVILDRTVTITSGELTRIDL